MSYTCLDCGKLFSRKTEATKHIRKSHSREPLSLQGVKRYLFEVTFVMQFEEDFVGDETI